MSAACITLDQIESRAATSVLLSVYVRRVRDGLVAATLAKPLLKFLNLRLDQLKAPLRSGALNHLSADELSEVCGLIKNLNIYLLRLAEDSELQSHRSLKKELSRIIESVEDFESILENIYLALDPGFRKAVSSAVEQLNVGVGERAELLHRQS